MLKVKFPSLGLWSRTLPASSRASLNLDDRLLALSYRDWLTIRGLLANFLILGKTGSAKTTASGASLLLALLRHPRSSGILLASKPEDRAMFARLLLAAGIARQVFYFSSKDDLRINVFDHVLQTTGGSVREVVACLLTIGETLRMGGRQQGGGDDWKFWHTQYEMLVYHAVVLLKLALGRVSAPELQRFLAEAAQSPEELASERWRAGFCSRVMQAALSAAKGPADGVDCEEAVTYFLQIWPTMADRTRSSILTGVTGILFAFCTGEARQLLSGETNFDLSHVLNGAWLVVDMPPCVDGETGLLVGAALKYLVQKLILRRPATDYGHFTVVWADEYQQWVTTFDARHFLPTCRGHLGCLVALTQSIHGLHAALGGEAGDHPGKALLSQYQHLLVHALGSSEDAQFCSDLCGKRWTTVFGGSMGPAVSLADELFGRRPITSNFSRQMEAVLPARAFLNDLRCGGPENDFLADAIVVRTGQPFAANGENFLRTTWRQS